MEMVIQDRVNEYEYVKTLNVRGPSYFGLTRSISRLLMTWLLTSPGHQQPWYWLCRIGRFLFYLRRISTNCVVSIWRNDTKCKCMFMFPLKNLVRKGLRLRKVNDKMYVFCLISPIPLASTLSETIMTKFTYVYMCHLPERVPGVNVSLDPIK